MNMFSVGNAAVMKLYKSHSAPSTFQPSTLNTNTIKDYIVTISSTARIRQIQGRANSTAKNLMGEIIIDREYVPPHGSTFRRKIRIKI